VSLDRTIVIGGYVCLSICNTCEPHLGYMVQNIEIHFAPHDRTMFLAHELKFCIHCILHFFTIVLSLMA